MNRVLSLPIRVQLLLLAAVVAVPAAGLIALSGLRLRDQALRDARLDTARVADAILAEQRSVVAGASQLLQVLAELPEVRARDPAVLAMLQGLLALNPAYVNLLVADRDGTVWATAVPTPATSIADRRYFTNAIRTGRLSSGEFVVGRASARPSLHLAQPIRDGGGQVVGVVCVALSLEPFRARIAEANLTGIKAVLLDHRGIILARAPAPGRYEGTPYPAAGFRAMAAGPDAHTFEGPGLVRDRRIITWRKLRLPGEEEPFIYTRVGIPLSTVLADSSGAIARDVALLVSFLGLAVGLSAWLGKRSIADRVAALEAASRRVAAGDLDARAAPAVRGGELGQLAETLDATVARLGDRERALRESERSYREIFEATSDGILVARATDGRILEANRAAEAVFGRTREELLARSIDALCAPAAEEIARTAAVGEGPRSFEWSSTRGDGTPFWAEATLQPAPLGGEGRVLAVVRDVTGRRRAAEENARLQAELAHAQKLESVGRLAGGVAHDFNNMLTVILGEADLIREASAAGDERRLSAEEISRAALRSRDVTRQLLAFSRKQAARPRPVDLNALAERTRHALARLVGEDVELVLAPAPDLWPVRLDPVQLDQILVNLAVNARDAMPGGGRVTISTSNVAADVAPPAALAGLPPGEYVLLAVRDEGTGMDERALAHLFEPFFTTKGPGKGTGLGLATVYGIVTQNGGFVRVDSAPGRGTTFRIYLPRTGEPAGEERGDGPPRAPGRGRILLVEDDDLVRATATKMLGTLGYEVTALGSPAEALALCARGDVAVDLLLTDLVMPEMRGPELRQRLRALRPGLRAIYMSGYAGDQVPGEVELVPKPFSAADLARAIDRALA